METPSKRASTGIGMLVILCQLAACGGGQSSPEAVPPPPVATFVVHPKYVIGAVIYAPPGAGSSITYGFGSVLGTTVSTTNSWSVGSLAGAQIGVASNIAITFGNAFGGADAHSVDMQETFAGVSMPFAPLPINSLNHDYDRILLHFGVNVNASVDSLGNVTWSMDFSQMQFAAGAIVTVGCLRANSTIPASQCVGQQNFLSGFGITPDDYPNIVGADPFADPNASAMPDPNRYVLVYSFGYAPSQGTVTLSLNNNLNVGNSQVSTYSYTVDASTSSAYDGVSLRDPTKFTWTNSSTLSNKTGGNKQPISVVIAPPSSPYSGPFTLFMYQDTIYKTFMFTFTPPPH